MEEGLLCERPETPAQKSQDALDKFIAEVDPGGGFTGLAMKDLFGTAELVRKVETLSHVMGRLQFYLKKFHPAAGRSDVWSLPECLYLMRKEFSGSPPIVVGIMKALEEDITAAFGENVGVHKTGKKKHVKPRSMPHTQLSRKYELPYISFIRSASASSCASPPGLRESCGEQLPFSQAIDVIRINLKAKNKAWKLHRDSMLKPEEIDDLVQEVQKALAHNDADWEQRSAILRLVHSSLFKLMLQGEWTAVDNFLKRLDSSFELPTYGLFQWTVLPNFLFRGSMRKLEDSKGDSWILRDKFDVVLTEVMPGYLSSLAHWKGTLQGRLQKTEKLQQLCVSGLLSASLLGGRVLLNLAGLTD